MQWQSVPPKWAKQEPQPSATARECLSVAFLAWPSVLLEGQLSFHSLIGLGVGARWAKQAIANRPGFAHFALWVFFHVCRPPCLPALFQQFVASGLPSVEAAIHL